MGSVHVDLKYIGIAGPSQFLGLVEAGCTYKRLVGVLSTDAYSEI